MTKLEVSNGVNICKPTTRISMQAVIADPDIYAGGDCVENTHLITGKKVYVPLGSTANKHGRIIGDNVTGGSEKFRGVLGTTLFKIFDYTVGCTGLTEKTAKELG